MIGAMTILARRSGEPTKDFAARILTANASGASVPPHQVQAAQRAMRK